jgi:hypothetical protein
MVQRWIGSKLRGITKVIFDHKKIPPEAKLSGGILFNLLSDNSKTKVYAIRMMNPPLLFATSPGYVHPVEFPLHNLDTGTLLKPVADFTLGFQVNGM